ncbi:hypothetical protein [Actinophytocola glycyrrhizae]|uniref:YbaB/EbfC DNA-binding family protein n=1 Tax=Actinophytocola glycyrrhizae TaxID=2044873 RepID=A0ABV9S1W6_9PSEU
MSDEHSVGALNDRARRLSDEAAHVYSVTRRRKEALRAAEARALKVSGEAASHDGSVRARVDAGGMLTELVLTDKALRSGPGELARLVTTVTQRAAADARSSVRDTYDRLRDEGIVRGVPVLLPAPQTEAPQRPGKPEEEASYEERSVVRRRGPR